MATGKSINLPEGNLDEFAAALVLATVVKHHYRCGVQLHSPDDWRNLASYISAYPDILSGMHDAALGSLLSPLYRDDPHREVGAWLIGLLTQILVKDRRQSRDDVSIRTPPGSPPNG